jgi:hypothetical protein
LNAAKRKALHKRLSSARALLIQWRSTIRSCGPSGDDDREGHANELLRFDEAIKAVYEARNLAKAQRAKTQAPGGDGDA